MANLTLITKSSMAIARAGSIVQKSAVLLGATSMIFLSLGTASAKAVTLSNGSLEVTIREDNGAIDTVLFDNMTFFASDFFNPGAPVSDFGFQNGTNTSTFVINTTTDFSFSTQQPVSVSSSGDSVSVTGTYTGGGANVDFTRTYSLVPDFNVLSVSTEFVNNGSDVALRYFDTFDPDQGIDQGNGFGTFNDVLSLSTDAGLATVGQATEQDGLTVVLGSLDPDVTVASGNPFQIFDGFDLNNFFNDPFDGNGDFVDLGTHIGIELLLAAGESGSFKYHQAYGQSITEAQEQFILAKSIDVPEPASVLGLLAVSAIGAGSALKRKEAMKG
ncbi:PEP-CTERM sorting domain-containing protein [Moorena sp. SIO3H5]|uniref:PEP-CTERM sorting domain-containing protein n=1 Tax=Moorena sp. SIO3H5 TaxID=2607834 RepID=UPI0025F36A95|nr:PEP-CTERM sorting domain-containing protein [Moorena sp. SIO3H5]